MFANQIIPTVGYDAAATLVKEGPQITANRIPNLLSSNIAIPRLRKIQLNISPTYPQFGTNIRRIFAQNPSNSVPGSSHAE